MIALGSSNLQVAPLLWEVPLLGTLRYVEMKISVFFRPPYPSLGMGSLVLHNILVLAP